MIPNDYCRCTGMDCDRREKCERFIAWRDKTGSPVASVSNKLCQFDGQRCFGDYYSPVKEQS